MIDSVTIEMIGKAIDDFGAWILFFFSLLGIALSVIVAALVAFLILRAAWRFLAVNTWSRFVVSLERKALRQ